MDLVVSLDPGGFRSQGQNLGIDSRSLRAGIAKTGWNKTKTGFIPL